METKRVFVEVLTAVRTYEPALLGQYDYPDKMVIVCGSVSLAWRAISAL